MSLVNQLMNQLFLSPHTIRKGSLIFNHTMCTTAARLGTYNNWKNKHQSPSVLASAGFYFLGYDDKVCCYYCGVILGLWTKDDNPWIEHKLYSRTCFHLLVNENKSPKSIVRMSSEMSLYQLIKLKFLKYFQEHALQTTDSANQEIPPEYTGDQVGSSANNNIMCKICLDREIEYLLLPCSHLGLCSICVTTQDKCPFCRGEIIHVLKIFRV